MRRPAAFVLALALAAQPPPPAKPVFKASANLVLLTVFVRDKQGKAVEGLQASDFDVSENGTAQKLSVFEFQKVAGRPLDKFSAPITAETVAAQADKAVPEAPPNRRDRRLLVFYFDWSSLQPAQEIQAREAAGKFLREQLTESDLVSFMSFSSKLKTDVEFTGDREKLLSMLARYENPEIVTEVAAEGEENDPEAAFSADDAEFNLFNTDRRLSALEQAVRELGRYAEKKALLFFSSGVGRTGVENQAQLRATINAAVRANVSFYPVDVRGLMAAPPGGDASARAQRGTGLFTGTTVRQQRQSFNDTQDTLYALAADTGGRAALDSNDLTVAARQAQRDIQSYYLLGYYSSNETKDGRFRRVEVKLSKALEARVDYRRGYFAEKEFRAFTGEDKERQLEEALWSGDPVTDLPVALEVNWFRVTAERFFVPLAVKIPGSKIPLARKGARETTQLDFVAEVRNEKNVRVATLRDTIRITLPESRLQSRSLLYDTGFMLGPGAYRVKFLARENRTGQMGTFETRFVIPDWGKAPEETLRHSTMVLSAQREALANAAGLANKKARRQTRHPLVANGRKMIPSVTRVFQPGQTLTVLAEVYEAQVEAAVALYRDDRKVFESAPVASRGRVEIAVPLKALPPGSYTLQLNLIDPAQGRFSFPRGRLAIAAPAPPAAPGGAL